MCSQPAVAPSTPRTAAVGHEHGGQRCPRVGRRDSRGHRDRSGDERRQRERDDVRAGVRQQPDEVGRERQRSGGEGHGPRDPCAAHARDGDEREQRGGGQVDRQAVRARLAPAARVEVEQALKSGRSGAGAQRPAGHPGGPGHAEDGEDRRRDVAERDDPVAARRVGYEAPRCHVRAAEHDRREVAVRRGRDRDEHHERVGGGRPGEQARGGRGVPRVRDDDVVAASELQRVLSPDGHRSAAVHRGERGRPPARDDDVSSGRAQRRAERAGAAAEPASAVGGEQRVDGPHAPAAVDDDGAPVGGWHRLRAHAAAEREVALRGLGTSVQRADAHRADGPASGHLTQRPVAQLMQGELRGGDHDDVAHGDERLPARGPASRHRDRNRERDQEHHHHRPPAPSHVATLASRGRRCAPRQPCVLGCARGTGQLSVGLALR